MNRFGLEMRKKFQKKVYLGDEHKMVQVEKKNSSRGPRYWFGSRSFEGGAAYAMDQPARELQLVLDAAEAEQMQPEGAR